QHDVGSRVDLIHVRGTGVDATESREVWREKLRANDASLVKALEAAEEKRAVSVNGPPDCQPERFPLEEGIGIERIPVEGRIRREMVVPKKEEPRSVKVVCAGTSCNIHGAARGCAGT